jgi:hypothetical protein
MSRIRTISWRVQLAAVALLLLGIYLLWVGETRFGDVLVFGVVGFAWGATYDSRRSGR